MRNYGRYIFVAAFKEPRTGDSVEWALGYHAVGREFRLRPEQHSGS